MTTYEEDQRVSEALDTLKDEGGHAEAAAAVLEASGAVIVDWTTGPHLHTPTLPINNKA
jgi:hypothetical protein